MLVRHSKKLHPELDLDAARQLFIESNADKDLTGELITSSHDLYSVEALRDTLELRIGRQVPTDIFVFGKGEPERPDITKVGGRPYWPADRPWPNTEAGEPFFFLAQFNFADSRDLFSDLPGDVLLLLVEDANEYLYDLDRTRFEWLPLGITETFQFTESVSAVNAGPFYGAIYRSADYPEATDKAREMDISQSFELPILNGTKIGGHPHFIQGGEDSIGEFLCQLGSIQAAPDVPYPWVNQAKSLGLEFDDRGIYGESNELMFADMGCIFLFRDRNGGLKASFECF